MSGFRPRKWKGEVNRMAASGILRRIGIALGVEVDDKEARKDVDALKDFAKKALGTIMVGISLAKVTALANEFSAVNKVVKAATRELGDQRDIQQKILEAANLTRTSYGDTAKAVSSLVQSDADLFGNVDEAVKFNNAATMLFKTAGKTDEEIAGLMESNQMSLVRCWSSPRKRRHCLRKSWAPPRTSWSSWHPMEKSA